MKKNKKKMRTEKEPFWPRRKSAEHYDIGRGPTLFDDQVPEQIFLDELATEAKAPLLPAPRPATLQRIGPDPSDLALVDVEDPTP